MKTILILLSLLSISCGKISTTQLKKSDSTIDKKKHIMALSTKETTFTEISTINSSVLNGEKLQATGMLGEGDLVYITYNTQGSIVRGGLDIIKINSNSQTILSSLSSENSEFADIKKSDHYLFLVGQRKDLSQNRNFAHLLILDVSVPETPFIVQSLDFDGFYATSIDLTGDEAIVTVPNLGVIKLDISDVLSTIPIKETIYSKGNVLYAKYLHDYIITLGGQETHELTWLVGKDPWTLQSISPNKQEAPSRFVIHGNTIITNGGNTGLTIVDDLDKNFHKFSYSGGLLGTGNGLTVGSCNKLYLAQGEKGLMVFDIKNHEQPQYEGNFDYEHDAGSANNVYYHNVNNENYVFVADGKSGVRIVKVDHSVCEESTPQEITCSITNGMGVKSWNGSSYGSCQATSCNAGYILDGNMCKPQSSTCSIPNGTGTLEQINDGKFSIEQTLVYDVGLSYKYAVKIKNNSNKKIHDWSICFDFPHNINGGVFNAIGDINFENPNHRIYSHMNLYGNSSTVFNFIGYSGHIGTDRLSNIKIYDSKNKSCSDTPNYSSEVSCVLKTCNTNFHKEGDTCVSNTKSCTDQNGIGTQIWNGSSYGSCQLSSCMNGFHMENGVCKSNTKTCSVNYGTGTQTWNGTAWGSCKNIHCDNGAFIEILTPSNKCSKCLIGLIEVLGVCI